LEINNTKLNKPEIIKLTASMVIIPPLILLISWDFSWVEGWIVCLWFLLQGLLVGSYLYFKNPELLKERLSKNGSLNQQKWDKLFVVFYAILSLFWLIIPSLDRRFRWSPEFPYYITGIGFLFLLIATIITFNSIVENSFASIMVRIQDDRKQHVISTGFYSIIRHPMYFGAMFSYIGIPILLNSIWGFIFGLIVSLMFVARIFGEEKMLENELDGYKEYENKVKYRLIPFVW